MAGLDEVADELYGGAPSDFIARRDAAAKQARADGDRELAAQIAALRKPTVSAWLVNLLFQDDESLAEQIVALGDQLRDAERTLDGAELRSLTKARRDLVRGLVARARALARTQGHRASEATAQEVDATLTAALADPAVAEEVTSGRLTTPREYAGFGSVGIRPDLRVVDGDRSRPVVGRPGVRPTGKGSGKTPDKTGGQRAGGRRAGTSGDDRAHAVQADGDETESESAEARAAEERRLEAERRREQERRERRRRENEERLRRTEDAWQSAREKAREAAAARDAAADEKRTAAGTVRELRSKLAAAEREEAAADRALERAGAKEQSARKAVEAATEDVREAEAALRADPS